MFVKWPPVARFSTKFCYQTLKDSSCERSKMRFSRSPCKQTHLICEMHPASECSLWKLLQIKKYAISERGEGRQSEPQEGTRKNADAISFVFICHHNHKLSKNGSLEVQSGRLHFIPSNVVYYKTFILNISRGRGGFLSNRERLRENNFPDIDRESNFVFYSWQLNLL
jgi:hypothetical protein